MANNFDINVLPLYRRGGIDQVLLPGLHVATAPKRATRSRKGDKLIIFLTFEGSAIFSTEQVNQLLLDLEKSYYAKKGTVTSALRDIVDELNAYLLQHNLRHSGSSKQATGLIFISVIKGDHLYIAQSGPTHGILLTSGKTTHLHDPKTSGKGVGVSRNVALRFDQSKLSQGDLLIITPKIPKSWGESTFKDAHGQPLPVLSRRFLSHSGDDLEAVVIETAEPGDGELYLLEPAPRNDAALSAKETAAPPRPAPTQQETPPTAESPAQPPQAVTAEAMTSEDVSAEPRTSVDVTSKDGTAVDVTSSDLPEISARGQNKEARLSDLAALSTFRKTAQTALGWLRRTTAAARTLLGRMLPSEDMLNLPVPVMAISAVIVPLVVVTVAVTVYARVGRDQQHAAYYALAVNESQVALSQENLLDSRNAWANTLVYLNRAQSYQDTDESEALRMQAQTALDDLDGIVRLDFQPAITGNLSKTVKIRRMLATGRDLYMLDISSGGVLRAWLTGTGYEIDPNFRCGPGPYGSIIVGPLVDITLLPRGNQENAVVLGMDVNGNLLYCAPDEDPLSAPLIPPDSNWGEPSSITLENDNLYVLDPLTNAVWIYFGEETQFRESPRFFFVDEVPTLQGAIDMAISNDDLYILNSDGHMTLCVFSVLVEAPTSCNDPETYKDNRLGRQNSSVIEGARFFQVQYTQPPEPSLYFLDPITRSIYLFSLKLNMVQQFRSQSDLPEGLATAFAISPTRSIFMALDNQVFIAFLP